MSCLRVCVTGGEPGEWRRTGYRKARDTLQQRRRLWCTPASGSILLQFHDEIARIMQRDMERESGYMVTAAQTCKEHPSYLPH